MHPIFRHLTPVLGLTLLLLASACSRQGVVPTSHGPVTGLPPLSSLPDVAPKRQVSALQFELLSSPPVALCPQATATAGHLDLSPQSGGFAWAIYGLSGFPSDDSIVPVSVTIERGSPCWIAFADFGANRWELQKSDAQGTYTPTGADLLSPTHTCYVAVLSIAGIGNPTGDCSVSSLVLNASADLVLPQPVLHTLSVSGNLAINVPSVFDAEGSDPGAGAYQSITYHWDDGSADDVTTDPLTSVTHTWTTVGTHTVNLKITNDSGGTQTRSFPVTLADPVNYILVVYDSDIPESLELAQYYASSQHGRSVDYNLLVGLPLGPDLQDQIDRNFYETAIRDPLRTYIGTHGLSNQLKYILLIKGVPHRIDGTEDFDSTEPPAGDGISSTCSSVDSELCLIFSDPEIRGWVWNGPGWESENGAGFYLGLSNYDNGKTFSHAAFNCTWQAPEDNSGAISTFPLDYLVGRIDAYTWPEAHDIIDRSLTADKSGNGWVLWDTISGRVSLDTMVDPVWPLTDNSGMSGIELFNAHNYLNTYLDQTDKTLQGNGTDGLPAGAKDAVIAYAGWGVNHGGDGYPSGADYINNDLKFTYLPGCAWISYESFNGTDFNDTNGINRRGQGQIADFLRMGGTCAIGNAYEPYTIGVGDERIVYYRYVIKGDPWIEAAYKGLRLLSWQEVVVGDPLCRVK